MGSTRARSQREGKSQERAFLRRVQAPAVRPGDVVAERFEVGEVVGEGGMGVVHRARDRHTGQPVALKILIDRSLRRLERFHREARVLAELRHPGIVRYVAHGATAAGDPYLAMEWLEGCALSRQLRRERLTVDQTVALGKRVAEALGAAHERGIVHRDIKPGNLFLPGGEPREVKVLDFGIARLSSRAGDATRTGDRLGTPSYMAPEQVRGARNLDLRADLFSLGCVLYACLTGRAPFAGEHPMAVLAKILLEEPAPLARACPELPAPLARLIHRMLAKEPAVRPASAAEVARILDAVEAQRDTQDSTTGELCRAMTGGERRLLSVIMLRQQASTLPLGGQGTIAAGAARDDQRSARLRALVQRFGGHYEGLAHDSVVISFAGSAATDLAATAARCALAIAALETDKPIALATGRGMVAGRLAVGEVIDRVVQLLDAGRPAQDGIPIDETTAALIAGGFQVGGDGAALRLLGQPAEDTPTRTVLGRQAPFVGRHRELRILEALHEECAGEPTARVVLVTGPAGIGKSRLVQEFHHQLARQECPPQLFFGQAEVTRAGAPFGLLAPALRRAFGLAEGQPPELQQLMLRARVLRHLDALPDPVDADSVCEFLGELAGAPFPDGRSLRLRTARQMPRVMADQICEAWLTWLRAECLQRTTVLMLEDLQWGDLPSLQLVDGALRQLRELPLLVIGLARPEVHEQFPRLWASHPLTEIRLGGLSPRATAALVRRVLDAGADDTEVARLSQHSAGHPFFLEELLRARARGTIDTLPDSVVAMVQSRLETLPAALRRTLRAASIFGTRLWSGGVTALVGDSSDFVSDSLRSLCSEEILERHAQSRFPGEIEYSFRHEFWRSAAYSMLTERDCRAGHALAASWLERSGETSAVALAEHFARGEEWERAAGYFQRAAGDALDGNDMREARALAGRGLACGASGECASQLQLVVAKAEMWLGDNAAAAAAADAALALLPPGSAPWLQAASAAAVVSGRCGNFARLRDLASALTGHGPPLTPAAIHAHCTVACELLLAGQRDGAEPLVASLRAAGAPLTREPLERAWVARMESVQAITSGDPGRCLELSERSADDFRRAGDLRNACTGDTNLAFACIVVGEYRRAEQALARVLDTAERLGIHRVRSIARQNLGLALLHQGRLDEALAVESAALEEASQQGELRVAGAARVYLARIHHARGELSRAEMQARAAVAVLHDHPPTRAYALAVLGRVLLDRDQLAEALAAASQARILVEELGGIDDGEAFVYLTLIDALNAAGRRPEASEAAVRARTRLETQAARIRDPGFRHSFLSSVGEHARVLRLAGG
jgi:tetratricopeptide (TPR) repeat protein